MQDNYYNPKVSVWDDILKANTPPRDTNISQIILGIKNGTHQDTKDIVQKIRISESDTEKKDLKIKLSGICFNGTFKTRRDDDMIEHSGLCIFDFDKYDTADALNNERTRIEQDKHTFICFLSPSGRGLKVVVKIPKSNKDEHARRFHAYKNYINSKYFDVACSNLSRLCFDSYDPDVYHNSGSEIFTEIQAPKAARPQPTQPTQKINYSSDADKINTILKFPNLGDPRDGRNIYVFKLSCIFAEYRISQNEAEIHFTYLIADDFDHNELKKAVQSGYKLGMSNPQKEFEQRTYAHHTPRITPTPEPKKFDFKIERIDNNVNIYINNDTPRGDVYEAIQAHATPVTDIYIINSEGEEVAEYTYKLNCLFDQYQGDLTDRQRDVFYKQVIEIADGLSELHKGQYFALLESQDIGIDAILIKQLINDRRLSNEERAHKAAFDKLLKTTLKDLDNAPNIRDIERTFEAEFEAVKSKGKEHLFSQLLATSSEQLLIDIESNIPPSLYSGYTISGNDINFPSGQISLIAGASGHGKTVLLINSIINAARLHPDKKFILFSYEERDTIITQYVLNTFADVNLTARNKDALKRYFNDGSALYWKPENKVKFLQKKDEFFRDYIETGRILIKYVDFDARELGLSIKYICDHDNTIGGVFIDYLQLLNDTGTKKPRNEELKDIMKVLNNTAISVKIPFIIAAQLNREARNFNSLHMDLVADSADSVRFSNLIIGLWSMEQKMNKPAKGERQILKQIFEERTGLDNLNPENSPFMYITILKSREMQTGKFRFFGYDSNTAKVYNKADNMDDDDDDDDTTIERESINTREIIAPF